MTVTVGMLHTVPVLAKSFDDLVVSALDGEVRRVHVADAWLLDTARRDGVTPQVQAAVRAHVDHLVSVGASAVLVTCSSIGEGAESAGTRSVVPVLRVDTPMATEAVALASAKGAGGRIAVLATLASTLGPTGRLVERAAEEAGRELEVAAEVVDGAAHAADVGDRDLVTDLVADAVRRNATQADVIVLAQASMAAAAERAAVEIPVLSSPVSGVRALADVVTGRASR